MSAGRHARAYSPETERHSALHWLGWTPQHRAAKHRANVPVDSPSRAATTYGGRRRAVA